MNLDIQLSAYCWGYSQSKGQGLGDKILATHLRCRAVPMETPSVSRPPAATTDSQELPASNSADVQ